MDAETTGEKTKDVPVHVRHVGELEKVDFKMPEQVTLLDVWNEAYVELDIAKQDRDLFQAKDGNGSIDLTPHLGMSLKQAADAGIAKSRQFEIVAGTGGA